MKYITVSLDDEAFRRAEVAAVQLDTSVSALVKRFPSEVLAENSFDLLVRRERELRDRITSFSAADRLTRDGINERTV